MDIWLLIAEMAGLLGLAFVLGALAQRLRQSAIVGYLLAGAILGPLLFNRTAVQDVAELGVALLLFSIGLEFSFSRLRRMGARGFMVGALQILVTLGVFAALFAGRGPLPQALALGAIVFVLKALIILGIGVLVRIPYATALATSITLAQIGEFSFVLAAEAHRGGILSAAGASIVVDEENTIGDELAQEVVASLRHTHREALGCALAGEKP